MNSDDHFRLNTDVIADGDRHYSLKVDADKMVRGDGQIKYQPVISLSSPSLESMEFKGTIVHSKGRKEHVSLNLESRSFSDPVTISGAFYYTLLFN